MRETPTERRSEPMAGPPFRFHVCSFTDFSDLTIQAGGKSYRFEFSKRFGPTMIGKKGQTIETTPPIRSPFWRALELWCKQDYRVEGQRCVYDVPPPSSMCFVRIAGRHWLQIGPHDIPESCRSRVYEEMKLDPPTDAPEVMTEPDEWAGLREAPSE